MPEPRSLGILPIAVLLDYEPPPRYNYGVWGYTSVGQRTHRLLYAAFLDLTDAPVLVAGGGEVAARKAGMLLEAGAAVTVVAPMFGTAFDKLFKVARTNDWSLHCRCRPFVRTDLRGKRLVFAATDDLKLNTAIAGAAKRMGLLVNVAAPPEAGNFQVPAMVRRGRFSLAISTGGASAALAASWRRRLERLVGAEWEQCMELLEQRRAAAVKCLADPSARRRVLQALGKLHWARLVKRHGVRYAGRRMDALIRSAARRRRATRDA